MLSLRSDSLKYNAAIFDFDGTLANTAADVWKSVEYAAEKLGGHMDQDFMKDESKLGLPLPEIFRAVIPAMPEQLFKQFRDEIRRHYRTENAYAQTCLYPGIEALLLRLGRKKIPCYIVSAKPLMALERILVLKHWDGYFKAWYSQDMDNGNLVAKGELLQRLLSSELTGLHPVYIGDTYTDAIAAREVGLDIIAAAYGDGNVERLLSENPTYVVYSATELEAYF